MLNNLGQNDIDIMLSKLSIYYNQNVIVIGRFHIIFITDPKYISNGYNLYEKVHCTRQRNPLQIK